MNLVLDIHSHTVASGHAYSTVLENVLEAQKSGLELLAITDHAPAMPGSAQEFHFTNYKVIPRQINGVKVMMGIELNILNVKGEIDLNERTLKTLSPVIASLHPPTYTFLKQEMTEAEKREEITEALLNVMDNEYVMILGHLGDPRYPFDIETIVKKSVQTGILIEINNSSLNPSNFRFGSGDTMAEILDCCKKHNCPVVVGSDAHYSLEIGKFEEAKQLLDDNNFPENLVANTSVQYFLSLIERRSA